MDFKPPTKSEEGERQDKSNDVTARETIRQPWQQTFFKPALPLQPPNQPSPSARSLSMALPDPGPISFSAPNPNERIPLPVPTQGH
jgi:hypothetical protein